MVAERPVTARRVGRWALYGLGGLVGLVVLGFAVAEIYLATPAGRAMVARQIAARIDLPVEVTSVRLGLRSSSIGLRVLDPSAAGQPEIIAVQSANADVSLFDLVARSGYSVTR